MAISAPALEVIKTLIEQNAVLCRVKPAQITLPDEIFIRSKDDVDSSKFCESVSIVTFRELWRAGYLYYQDKLTHTGGEDTIYFAATGVARWLVNGCPGEHDEYDQVSNAILGVLGLMTQGYKLYVEETNGSTPQYKCLLKTRSVDPAILPILLAKKWITTAKPPTNPTGNPRVWRWVFCITDEGQKMLDLQDNRPTIGNGNKRSITLSDTDDKLNTTDLARNIAQLMFEESPHFLYRDIEAIFNDVKFFYRKTQKNTQENAIKVYIETACVWANERGLLNRDATLATLGMTVKELETAEQLGILQAEIMPSEGIIKHIDPQFYKFYDPQNFPVVEAHRARIAHETLLTRAEAAKRLGISHTRIRELLKTYDLVHIVTYRSQNFRMIPLYRLAEIDALAAKI